MARTLEWPKRRAAAAKAACVWHAASARPPRPPRPRPAGAAVRRQRAVVDRRAASAHGARPSRPARGLLRAVQTARPPETHAPSMSTRECEARAPADADADAERLAHAAVARERDASMDLPETREQRPRRRARVGVQRDAAQGDASPVGQKTRWDAELDDALTRVVASMRAYKGPFWRVVAERLTATTGVQRGAKQVRERWSNHLDPCINKAPLSDTELAFVDAELARNGPRWSFMAARLDGRTPMMLKNAASRRFGRAAIKRFRSKATARFVEAARATVEFEFAEALGPDAAGAGAPAALAADAPAADAGAAMAEMAALLEDDALELDLDAPLSRADSPSSEEDFGLAELQTFMAREERAREVQDALKCGEELPPGSLLFPEHKQLAIATFGEGHAAFKRQQERVAAAFARSKKQRIAAASALA